MDILEISSFAVWIKTFISRQNSMRKQFSFWIQYMCYSMSIVSSAKCTYVKFIQLTNRRQKVVCSWPKSCMIPR